ncbi:PilZ domain-containing protein [Magnetococcales bacterium HHB-1]
MIPTEQKRLQPLFNQTDIARNESRFDIVLEISLQMDNGFEVIGQTNNISSSGAFFLPDQPFDALKSHIQPGDCGLATVTYCEDNEETFRSTYPCSVARIDEEGIGLCFDCLPDIV